MVKLLSVTKLEATPAELGEGQVRVVLVTDGPHSLDIGSAILRERLLELASVTHVDELGSETLGLIDLVVVGEKRLVPSSHSEIVLGASPRSGELPPCNGVLVENDESLRSGLWHIQM